MECHICRTDISFKSGYYFTADILGLSSFASINPEVRDTIARHVQERVVDGIFRQKNNARVGVITWRAESF
ncbi:MAG: hypothetical protein QHH75_07570 [Bacillota bacterium]|nr:hypothetical protein [Bacillota bacterium]